MSATIFPTGVTIYNPEKCWSGYTILQAAERGALLIDMNGNEVRMWEGLQGFPNKMLPGRLRMRTKSHFYYTIS